MFNLDITHTKKLDGVTVKILNGKRFTQHGFGTFMTNIKKGEVRITKDALEILLGCSELTGLQGMEFWPQKMLAWGSLSPNFTIPSNSINVPPEAKKWIRQLWKETQ